jgi:hypothetical protein
MVLELGKGEFATISAEVGESGLAGPCLLIAPSGPEKNTYLLNRLHSWHCSRRTRPLRSRIDGHDFRKTTVIIAHKVGVGRRSIRGFVSLLRGERQRCQASERQNVKHESLHSLFLLSHFE